MARPIRVTVGPLATADPDNICTSQSPLGAGALTLVGDLVSGGVATLDTPRRVLFTFAADETGHSFVLTGTDRSGFPASETLAGAAATAQSVLDYATVTSITISAASAGAITVGTNGVASSAYVALNAHGLGPVHMQFNASGTVNYTLESTDDDLWNPANIPLATWVADGTVASKTGTFQSTYTAKPLWSRVTLNSGTGSVVSDFVQAGLAGI